MGPAAAGLDSGARVLETRKRLKKAGTSGSARTTLEGASTEVSSTRRTRNRKAANWRGRCVSNLRRGYVGEARWKEVECLQMRGAPKGG